MEIREATPEDAPLIGRLLDAFNREYDDPTPGPEALAARVATLIEGGDTSVLLAGDAGIAVLRLRRALWSEGLEAYLAELYVVPALRNQGIGRRLMEAVLEHARAGGADTIDLNTSIDDTQAVALYEKLGFTNLEGGPGGPSMLYYEREL